MQSIKEEAKPVPEDTEEPPEQGSKRPPSKRPALVKQKHSFPFPALQEEATPVGLRLEGQVRAEAR